MRACRRWLGWWTLLAAGVPAVATGQAPLSLREALARADRLAYANRIAVADHSAEAGAALASYAGFLPTLRVEAGYLETTDPLTAFGFTLRQRTVTAAAFAPARLNDPDPNGDLMTGVVMEQPLFNPQGWLGRQAATRAASASAAGEVWTRAGTAVEVVKEYWGAVFAGRQVAALRAALDAAGSHVRQAESMARQGMVTRSDVLLATVKTGELEIQLLNAESQHRLAQHGLAVLLGDPLDTLFALPDSLPSAQRIADGATRADSAGPIGARADVAAAEFARDAARADASRATARYFPTLSGFGRIDWNNRDTPFGGSAAWTVGVLLRWTPFAGGSELGEIRAGKGRTAAAQALAEAAKAQAGLEGIRSRDALSVALARMEITSRSVIQAAEAHRIVGRKYDGGLATVTELFDAAAIETNSQLSDAASRYDVIVAMAELRKTQGLDLSPLLDLETR